VSIRRPMCCLSWNANCAFCSLTFR
jgi:hypothetical protein